MKKTLKIIDEESEIVISFLLDGGLIKSSLATRITGVSRQYLNRLKNKGRIRHKIIGGECYFDFLDCYIYRFKRSQGVIYSRREVRDKLLAGDNSVTGKP